MSSIPNPASSIISPIIAGVDKISRFVSSISWNKWVLIYATLAILCALYLASWRKKKLDEQTSYLASSANSKRQRAIEQFQNFNSQLATELNQQCEAELDTESVEPVKTRDNIFLNSNLGPAIMVRLSPGTKAGYAEGMLILDSYLFTIDGRINDFITKTSDAISSIITGTQRNNQYAQEVKLDTFLDLLPAGIKEFGNTLETEFTKSLTEAQVGLFKSMTTIEKENMATQLDIELRERLFDVFATEKRKVFRLICKGRAEVKGKQSQLDSGPEQQQADNSRLNTELDALKLSLADMDAQYKGYIFALSRFATTTKALELLKRESGAMTTLLIQPANENQIDGLGLIKQKLANQAAKLDNPVTNNQAEIDLSSKYSGAYQDYLDSLDKNSITPKLDPVSIIGNLEEQTLDFLTKVNSKLQGDSLPENKSAFQVDNRFQFQPNNLGSWMVDSNHKSSNSNQLNGNLSISKTPVPASDISKLDQFANVNSHRNSNYKASTGLIMQSSNGKTDRAREGFQNSQDSSSNTKPSTSSTTNGYLAGLDSFFSYIYELVTGFMDKETVAKLDGLLSAEDNMIPIGVILIGVSVILYLASAGDNKAG